MSQALSVIKKRYRYNKTIYRDMYGFYRYGYGHNFGPKLSIKKLESLSITRKDALVKLEKDVLSIRKKIEASLSHIKSLNEKHLDLMVLLFYDIGEKAFFNSRFFMFYSVGEQDLAFEYFNVWKNVLGERSKVAEYRRNQELKLIKEK